MEGSRRCAPAGLQNPLQSVPPALGPQRGWVPQVPVSVPSRWAWAFSSCPLARWLNRGASGLGSGRGTTAQEPQREGPPGGKGGAGPGHPGTGPEGHWGRQGPGVTAQRTPRTQSLGTERAQMGLSTRTPVCRPVTLPVFAEQETEAGESS